MVHKRNYYPLLIPLSFKVINKLAIEPGFICFPTNLKLIEGEPYSRVGGRLFDVWPNWCALIRGRALI